MAFTIKHLQPEASCVLSISQSSIEIQFQFQLVYCCRNLLRLLLSLPMTKSQTGSLQGKQWGSVTGKPTITPQVEPTKLKHIEIRTTFVQTDTNSFRELVQKLTGVSEDSEVGEFKFPTTMPAKFANSNAADCGSVLQYGLSAFNKSGIEMGPRKSAFKLHERRQCPTKLQIKLGLHSTNPHRLLPGEVLSLPLPALIPSPISPLGPDGFTSNHCTAYSPNSTPTSGNHPSSSTDSREEKSITGEGFCFQPLPSPRHGKIEPELLSLFPLHSPRRKGGEN